ncbi:TetR/AcrR family transcriptional regulator [Nocardia sp. NPDC101769]|uniref:TetR/AcrR family transcriptional regulator n=1 Tax=Nocardia sp. NPDC101769 TaxID=3364333 RepID=UPI0037FBBB62
MNSERVSTKERLLEVAEELFAERGVDATLVGDIVQGAGQRNPSALRYHFGSREGVLEAILQKHLSRVEERRTELFEQWSGPGPETVRDAVSLIVTPLVELLDSQSGRRHLQILAQSVHRFDQSQLDALSLSYPTMAATVRLMGRAIGQLPEAVIEERVRSVLQLTMTMLSVRARSLSTGSDIPLSAKVFEENLVAMVTAALTAPLSPEQS